MDVLEKLKDDNEYYRGVGKKYLSNSDIGALLNNPVNFGVAQPDNPAFAKGRLFHQLLLEPEKAKEVVSVESNTRTTKVYKEFIESNNMSFCLLNKEVEEVKKLTSIMKKNLDFYELIYNNTQFEQPMIKKIKGLMWKGKADVVGSEYLIDIKTTSDIQKFKWSCRSYNYDSQAYIYQELFGKPLVFLVIDKKTGVLGKFTPTEDFISRGEEKVERAIEVYNNFFGQNKTLSIDNYYICHELN
jgi:hypothetical protein